MNTGLRSEHSYSLYVLNKEDHLIGPALLIHADDDEHAITEVRKTLNGHAAELRDGLRLVKQFNPSQYGRAGACEDSDAA